jgi:hypothetical protein
MADGARQLSQGEVSRLIRARLAQLLVDDSGMEPAEVALYTLSDPRDLRLVRYVGQSRLPRRRLLQHLNAARLWLPDERPWWVKDEKLRPLYEWLRSLFRDGMRLPAMIVTHWVPLAAARHAERERIHAALQQRLPLLNFEATLAGAQLALPLSAQADAPGQRRTGTQ